MKGIVKLSETSCEVWTIKHFENRDHFMTRRCVCDYSLLVFMNKSQALPLTCLSFQTQTALGGPGHHSLLVTELWNPWYQIPRCLAPASHSTVEWERRGGVWEYQAPRWEQRHPSTQNGQKSKNSHHVGPGTVSWDISCLPCTGAIEHCVAILYFSFCFAFQSECFSPAIMTENSSIACYCSIFLSRK